MPYPDESSARKAWLIAQRTKGVHWTVVRGSGPRDDDALCEWSSDGIFADRTQQQRDEMHALARELSESAPEGYSVDISARDDDRWTVVFQGNARPTHVGGAFSDAARVRAEWQKYLAASAERDAGAVGYYVEVRTPAGPVSWGPYPSAAEADQRMPDIRKRSHGIHAIRGSWRVVPAGQSRTKAALVEPMLTPGQRRSLDGLREMRKVLFATDNPYEVQRAALQLHDEDSSSSRDFDGLRRHLHSSAPPPPRLERVTIELSRDPGLMGYLAKLSAAEQQRLRVPPGRSFYGASERAAAKGLKEWLAQQGIACSRTTYRRVGD